jgi:hypothetical protein
MMSLRNRLSILSNARSTDFILDPYPHLVIKNALDAEVFVELEATFPEDSVIVNGRPVADTWFDYPACKALRNADISPRWQQFFSYHTSAEFFQELVALSGDSLRALNPGLETRVGRPLEDFKVGMRPGGKEDALAPGADVSMECQFYINYTTKPRTIRGPHVDRPSELFAALLYFRQPADNSEGGDLDICESSGDLYPDEKTVRIFAEQPAAIAPSLVKTVRTVPYEANTLVLFLNSPRSIHAVSPRTPTPLTRRHINFCCDVPFQLFNMKVPVKLALKKKLDSIPLGRRLAKYIR